MEPEAHAAPQPTLPHEKTTPSYASLLQIRQRLAGQASQVCNSAEPFTVLFLDCFVWHC